MKTFEYRLFVDKEQSRLLMQCLSESRMIYNEMLETVKQQYKQDGTFPGKYDLEKAFKGQREHVPATTVQMLADRLSNGFSLPKRMASLVLASRVSRRPIDGTPSNFGNTAKTAICMKTKSI